MGEQHVLCGAHVDTNIGATLGQLLQAILGQQKDNVLQIDAMTGEKLTARTLLSKSIRLVKWLQTERFTVGDTICISSENSLDFTVVFCACLLLGITIAPVNPAYTLAELQHVLKIIKPKIIFSTLTGYKTIQLAVKTINSKAEVLVMGGQVNTAHFVTLHGIILQERDEAHFVSPALDVHETIAAIMCSSGTTGMPKGVMLSQHNIIAMLCIMKQNASDSALPAVPGVSVGIVPFFHSMGLLVSLITVLAGTKLLIFKKFVWHNFLQIVQDYKITTLVLPPPIIVMLCQSPDVEKYDLSALEYIRSSAAPMSKELQQKASERFKLKLITQGYGLTEATLGVLLPEKNKFGSVGSIVPGMKVKVVDDVGRALGPHQHGELCFSGPLIMKGYAGDPKATAATIDKDGWLHTGDIGYYEEDGYFYIVDRLKELIKYKGFQVPPAELENILREHPAVADAIVIGLPDELAGELPMAFVAVRPGYHPTEAQIKSFVHEKVSPQKYLRGGVRFVEKIPRNAVGKALRRVLRDMVTKKKSKL